ncbi:MAG: TolB family protein [Candidatus Hodarchaeota archaeon]
MKNKFMSQVLALAIVMTTSSSYVISANIKIAYTLNEGGNYDIYVLTLDENLNIIERIRLTDWSSYEHFPCWSLDGKKIAFCSSFEGGDEVWIMDADGNNKIKITNTNLNACPLVWSLHEDYVYGLNSRAGDGEVAEFELFSGNIKMLTNVQNYNTQRFDLNSDQTTVTFVRGIEGNGWTNELFIADFTSDGTDFYNVVKLQDDIPAPHTPKFSPDDSRITFTIMARPQPNEAIGIINVDGTGFWIPVPKEINIVNHSPEWIDNNRIIFSRGLWGSEDLYVLDLRDMSIIQITNEFGQVFQAAVLQPIEVSIDIKPSSDPNSLNLGSNGNIPVAIFSTSNFDATTVDPLTVTLAGASLKLKGKGIPMSSFEDVNGDSLLDIVVHVDTTALELSEGDTEALLEGQTYDGMPIKGKDTVRIIY